jgi:hypothetical protein
LRAAATLWLISIHNHLARLKEVAAG